jgi:hypothetical protein
LVLETPGQLISREPRHRPIQDAAEHSSKVLVILTTTIGGGGTDGSGCCNRLVQQITGVRRHRDE